ncbi:Fc.00g000560.m01.CDS01 [Cosmosporella sp. VM-42]
MCFNLETRSLITDVGSVVSELENGIGVTEIENQLDALLGNSLTKLEGALGVTFAEKLLGLVKEGAPPGAIQAIGEGVAMVLEGASITEVNQFIDNATGVAISSLEGALGVTDIEEALGLA